MSVVYDMELALERFTTIIVNEIGQDVSRGRFIRDVFGSLSYAPGSPLTEERIAKIRASIPPEIEPYLSQSGSVLQQPTLIEALLQENGIVRYDPSKAFEYTLLDRRLAGEDWMQRPSASSLVPPRFAFYGLKGGVGRSTALAVAAVDLAKNGLNILVVDLDLEAPGLGSILLNPSQQPEYGVLDWLAAGSVGLDLTEMMPDMVGGSDFSLSSGVIDVVPASGAATLRAPTGFLSKLARAYTPGASKGKLSKLNFTQKIDLLLQDLSITRRYDVVLLDVRAGLHETSASALLGLGATSFLFGSNSSQTAVGYTVLLSSIRQAMVSWPDAPDLRDRFQMVQGRASASMADRNEFRTLSWQIWLDNLYESVSDEVDANSFSFDLNDASGPHYPWVIPNSELYLAFDPQKDAGFLASSNYLPVFDGFLNNLRGKILRREVMS